jgi:beta-glucosidase
MSLDEKVSLMGNDSPGVARLGIPAYNWWNEALHGVMHKSAQTSVFPQPIGLGASFDAEMVFKTAQAVGDEARALFEETRRKNAPLEQFTGITLWSPNVNFLRDPRWGRGHETFGEDPILISRMATAYVHGLQGDDPVYLKTASTVKHFVAHNGPEQDRFSFDTKISARDLWDSEMPGFRAAIVEGHAQSLMTAYNAINGVPASANETLVRDIAINRWGLPGYVVTDCGATGGIYYAHNYTTGTSREIEGVAKAIEAGVDLDCGGDFQKYLSQSAQGRFWGLGRSYLNENLIDQALARLLIVQFRLGILGDSSYNPYSKIPLSVVNSAQHRELALASAHESIVLLKNQASLLPLAENKLQKVLVVGPNADSILALSGTYAGRAPYYKTPLAALRAALPQSQVVYVKGVSVANSVDGGTSNPNCTQARRLNLATNALAELDSSVFRGDFTVAPSDSFRTSTAADSTQGLDAQYYAHASTNRGPPVQRTDGAISFDWGDRSPDVFPPDYSQNLGDDFKVVWKGFLRLKKSGSNRFVLSYDDGAIVDIGGQKLISDWNAGPARESCFDVVGKAGDLLPITIQYFEQSGNAKVQLSSDSSDQLAVLKQEGRDSDVVLAFMGVDPRLEGENHDKSDTLLPREQEKFLGDLQDALPGKPLVLVLLNGNPLSLQENAMKASAILEAWYPGQEGGQALADVILGRYNPAGRMPATAYAPDHAFAALSDYSLQGRTYRYLDQVPQFPFGYGLSYTQFSYDAASAQSASSSTSDNLKLSVEVKNTGHSDGDEVVQIYADYSKIRGLEGRGTRRPWTKLVAFRRVFVRAGQKVKLDFEIAPRDLALVDAHGTTYSPGGVIRFWIGAGQPAHAMNPKNSAGLWIEHERRGEDFALPL